MKSHLLNCTKRLVNSPLNRSLKAFCPQPLSIYYIYMNKVSQQLYLRFPMEYCVVTKVHDIMSKIFFSVIIQSNVSEVCVIHTAQFKPL